MHSAADPGLSAGMADRWLGSGGGCASVMHGVKNVCDLVARFRGGQSAPSGTRWRSLGRAAEDRCSQAMAVSCGPASGRRHWLRRAPFAKSSTAQVCTEASQRLQLAAARALRAPTACAKQLHPVARCILRPVGPIACPRSRGSVHALTGRYRALSRTTINRPSESASDPFGLSRILLRGRSVRGKSSRRNRCVSTLAYSCPELGQLAKKSLTPWPLSRIHVHFRACVARLHHGVAIRSGNARRCCCRNRDRSQGCGTVL